jgi:hypothetical protein
MLVLWDIRNDGENGGSDLEEDTDEEEVGIEQLILGVKEILYS